MRVWPAAFALLAIGCAARGPRELSPTGAPATVPRTPRDGVYTVEQSRRGEEVYFATCVRCHKAEMTGSQIVPPLSGEVFLSRWRTRTAGDLFEWVRGAMPPGDAAAQMTPQDYADVLAYILSRNDFPAGSAELATDFAALRMIRMAPETEAPAGGATPGPKESPAGP